MSILIDDALAGHDPTTVIKLYSAPPELDPFSEAAIRAANPAFGTFLNSREVLGMAGDAAGCRRGKAEYRNLILNQRVEASAPFLTPAVWAACGGEPLDITGRSVFAGLDLSETSNLTALVLAHCARTPASGISARTSGCLESGWRRRRRATMRPMICGPSKGFSKQRPAHRSLTNMSPSG